MAFALRTLRLADTVPQTLLSRRQILLFCLALFLFAFAIRTLTWQDNRSDAWKVQTSVTHRYKESARQLVNGEFKTFLTDIPRLGHPPGYPIVLAALFRTVGESDTALQFLQIIVDSISVVLLFLISLELFSLSVSLVAGFLAALSPQFAYFSVLLLPDSLVVLPILLAVYLVVRVRGRFRWGPLLIAGVLIGVSCWLRANALFLPLFIGGAAALTTVKGKRLLALVTVIIGAVIAIGPITIKNAIVFRTFIPLSLGSGQTLLEGLADYDPKGTLNIPSTDVGLIRQEAEWYARPDYAQGLFNVDGIERDRIRVKRGITTIAQHPVWFAGVMARRALASTRLDPVLPLRSQTPVRERMNVGGAAPIWSEPQIYWQITDTVRLSENDQIVIKTVTPANSLIIDGEQKLLSDTIQVAGDQDYVFKLPTQVVEGRVTIKVLSNGEELAATILETQEQFGNQQPSVTVDLPFIARNNRSVQLAIANNAAPRSTLRVGQIELFQLGPSSMTWLRYVRIPLRLLQLFFTTAWTIPLLIVGLALLVRRQQRNELLLLMAVPAYYLVVQSALHTERRYVYVIHFFFQVIVSVALCWIAKLLVEAILKSRRKRVEMSDTL